MCESVKRESDFRWRKNLHISEKSCNFAGGNYPIKEERAIMPNDHDIWQPQERGKAWKGAGLYHVTLTIPSREPLLGELVIPEKDPKQARIDILPLGRALLEIQKNHLPSFYPEIQILHYCLMPDHLHAV